MKNSNVNNVLEIEELYFNDDIQLRVKVKNSLKFVTYLFMIKERVINAVEFVSLRNERKLQIRNNVLEIIADSPIFIISINEIELDRWIHFVLRGIRDGAFEVDHIDLEFKDLTHRREILLTLQFPNFATPLDPISATNKLGG